MNVFSSFGSDKGDEWSGETRGLMGAGANPRSNTGANQGGMSGGMSGGGSQTNVMDAPLQPQQQQYPPPQQQQQQYPPPQQQQQPHPSSYPPPQQQQQQQQYNNSYNQQGGYPPQQQQQPHQQQHPSAFYPPPPQQQHQHQQQMPGGPPMPHNNNNNYNNNNNNNYNNYNQQQQQQQQNDDSVLPPFSSYSLEPTPAFGDQNNNNNNNYNNNPSAPPSSSYTLSGPPGDEGDEPFEFPNSAPAPNQTHSSGLGSKQPLPANAHFAPFEINEEAAFAKFKEWILDLWLAPSNFVETVPDPVFCRYYIPFYCFTAEVENRFSALAMLPVGSQGNIAPVRGGLNQSEKKEWQPVNAKRKGRYADIGLLATDEEKLKALLDDFPHTEWDVAKANIPLQNYPREVEYAKPLPWSGVWSSYLSDSLRDKERKAAAAQLESEGLSIKQIKCQVTYSSLIKRMVLLPVWLGVYRFESKEFYLLVHGQTGKVMGERPYGIGQTKSVLSNIFSYGAEAIENLTQTARETARDATG